MPATLLAPRGPWRRHPRCIRKRAKQLLRDHQSGLVTVAERLRRGLPRFADMSDAEVLRAPLALHDAQLLIARELGFANWSDLVRAPSLPSAPPLAREVSWRSFAQIFVRDVDSAAAFYEQVLGFELDYRYGDPPFYAQIHRDAAVLNLRFTESSPWASDVAGDDLLAARVEVDDVKALFLEVRGNGAAFHQALRAEPWGQVTFVVRDLDGNLICFGSPNAVIRPTQGVGVSFSPEEIEYLASQPLARLATVAADGQPDVVPVAFEFDGSGFWIGGSGAAVLSTRKFRNVTDGNASIALVVDDLVSIDPFIARGIRVYGCASGPVTRTGLIGPGIYIRITPRTSWSWNMAGEPAGEEWYSMRRAHHEPRLPETTS